MMDPPKIKDWNRIRELGSGTYGVVTLWINRVTKKSLAIKKCKHGFAARPNEKQRSRWLQEVAKIQKLTHPNLVAYRQMPEELREGLERNNPHGLPIISMEFCALGNLRDQLNRQENLCGLREGTIVEILSDVSQGLLYLHSKNVTHRDLKPENIVLQHAQWRQSGVVYKIIDLGYAKEIQDTFSFVGTFEYLAPEMFLGEHYTNNVDCWSLGIVVYEIICGTRPFLPTQPSVGALGYLENKAADVISIQETHTGDIVHSADLPDEIWINAELGAKLAAWLRSVLQADPKKRAASPQALNDLCSIIQKKCLSLFFPHLRKFDFHEIDNETPYAAVQETIVATCGVKTRSDLLFVPSKRTRSDCAIDYHDDTNRDAMIFVFDVTNSRDHSVALAPIPKLIQFLLQKEYFTRYAFQRLFAQMLYYIDRQATIVEAVRNSVCFLEDFLKDQDVMQGRLINEMVLSQKMYGSEIDFYNLLESNVLSMINLKNSSIKVLFFSYKMHMCELHHVIRQIDDLANVHKNISSKFREVCNCSNDLIEKLQQCDYETLRINVNEIREKFCEVGEGAAGPIQSELIKIFSQTIRRTEDALKKSNDFFKIVIPYWREMYKFLADLKHTKKRFENLKNSLRLIEIDKVKAILQDQGRNRDEDPTISEQQMSSLLSSLQPSFDNAVFENRRDIFE